MSTTRLQQSQSAELHKVCSRFGVRRLALFGSILREDFGPQSDIDVLVEFEPERVPGYFGLVQLEQELARLFPGRKIDLHTPGSLNPEFRAKVLAYAEVQFECGE